MQEKVAALVKDFVSEEECPKYIKASDLWEAFIKDNTSDAMESGWDSPQVFLMMNVTDLFLLACTQMRPHLHIAQ